MNKVQAIRFWRELQNNTENQAVLDKYKNRTGYDSERTLQRYVQVDNGFRDGLPLEDLCKKTTWRLPYVEKLQCWWNEEFLDTDVDNAPHVQFPPSKACPYDRRLRDLLGTWLEFSDGIGLQAWLTEIDEGVLSPAALLHYSRLSMESQSEVESRIPERISLPDAQKAWRDQHPENLWLPAPPNITESPLFPFLAEHLQGDSIWEGWRSSYLAIMELGCEAWTAANGLARYLLGVLAVSRLEQVAGHRQIYERIENDPGYRDALSSGLRWAFMLVGGQLLYKGLSEKEFESEGMWARPFIGRYLVKLLSPQIQN